MQEEFPTMQEEFPPGKPSLRASDVCAIVVTYGPDSGFLARLNEISPQVGMVVIVDNGSADAERNMLLEAAAESKINVVFNDENLGLARALNIGIQRAAGLQYSWVLLLDQDSRVDRDIVCRLAGIQASFPDPARLAVVGSNYGDIGKRTSGAAAPDPEPPGEPWDEVEQVITSGSLLSLPAHVAIGPFREEFFIDYIDEEYCLRARAHGYRVIRSRRELMSHAIGAPTEHRFLGFRKCTSNHGPDRRYYIARNNTVLLHEFGKYPAGTWALKSLGRCLRLCKRIALYESMKSRKIAAVMHGWWDGVHGNMGRRDYRPVQRGLRFSVNARVPSLRSSERTTR
ncbi:MAG TPA: glycosyltransferase family 2 protein [Steroidobacteraceae bacterium]